MKSLRNPNRCPTHPGAILREDILPALSMSQTEFAQLLDVSRLSVSELLHGKRALSPEMAMRIARLLNTSAESWMQMQIAVDLWTIQQEKTKLNAVKPLAKSRLMLIAL